MKKIYKLVLIVSLITSFAFALKAYGTTILLPFQGGTGIGTAVVGDVGNCITVADDSPLTYEFSTCGGGGTWGSITGTLSNQIDLQSALDAKQDDITLTTTGSSGASTLVGATLNIPTYTLAGLGGANTALSNLASVAINTSLLSDTTKTDDLGSATYKWRNLYTQNVYADAIGYNSLRSVFGERQIFVSEFTDALWRADRRFTATRTGTGTLASLFDAGFETTYVVPVSTTDVININMANQSGVPASGVTYPEGKIYVHFYYTSHQYSAISARVKQNGIWYALSAPTDISTDGVNKVLEFSVPSNNYMTDIELTVTTDGTNPVWITAMNYIPTRWTTELESPYVDKYLPDNTFIGNFTTFKNTAGTTTARINANDDWYMGVGGSGGKFGIGTSTPGTYRLNVVGNILGNDIVTNSGSVFKSLGTAYLRATGTNAIHIGDASAQPIDLGVGGGAVAINTDYSNIPSGTKLQVNAGSATSSSTILKLYGSSTGFSGANDAGTAYALTIDGTAYQTSIVQVPGAKIEMAKENTWNYADTPTGTLGSLKFYTSAGTPNSPTLTEKMRITSSGNVGIGGATTPLSKLDVRYDSTISATTPGTTGYGTIHLVPTTGTDGNSVGMSFGANNGGSVNANAQAGLYVQSSSAYGTKMHFATSNNFGTGATTRMTIDQSGNLNIGVLDTDLSAPSTSGTTKMVISDANGKLSFATIPTAGSSTFIGLTDVPANFTGSANKYVRVNAGETALEFVALAGGGDALKADPLSQFAATTSLQLKGVISDETGSGALVFADTPTLVTPILGTPTSVTLTNATGLPLTGLVSDTTTALGIGSINLGHASDTTIARVSAGLVSIEGSNIILASNKLSALSATTSLELAGVISDETGSSGLVFSDTPTLTTPVLTGTPNAAGELGRDSTQSTPNYYDNGMLGTIPKVIEVGTGTQALINSTASDQDFTSLYTLPANAIFTDKTYRVTATYEMVTGVSTVTLINYLKVCGTKVYTQTAQNFVNSTTVSFTMQYFIAGRAAASASSAVTTAATIGMGANFNGGNVTNQPVNLATNGTCAITPGVTYSGTGSTESLELQAWTVEEIN